MALLGKNPVRTKIVIDNSVLEQVSHFNYFGCDISYRKDNDIERKLNLVIPVEPVSYTHLDVYKRQISLSFLYEISHPK